MSHYQFTLPRNENEKTEVNPFFIFCFVNRKWIMGLIFHFPFSSIKLKMENGLFFNFPFSVWQYKNELTVFAEKSISQNPFVGPRKENGKWVVFQFSIFNLTMENGLFFNFPFSIWQWKNQITVCTAIARACRGNGEWVILCPAIFVFSSFNFNLFNNGTV